VVVLDPGGLEDDALVAGHVALNSSVQTALDDLMTQVGPNHQQITQQDIDAVVGAIQQKVHDAIVGAFASQVVALASYYTADGYQNVIVATANGDVSELWWQGGAAVGQGVIGHFNSPVVDLGLIGVGAFSASSDNRQHVIAGMSNGNLREFFWTPGDSSGVHHDDLANLPDLKPVIDAHVDPSGYQHLIAATSDGNVQELYWASSLPTVWVPTPPIAI
jgi:hypothetical protein